MGGSYEKLESMSKADAMNFSSFSQDLTHSNSPFYMETNTTTSDLSQNEIKNVKKENESKLSEEIYSTLDDTLDDVNNGNYSQDILTEPADTSISSSRQFEPIFKIHRTEAFNDEVITFQNLTGGFPYTEKSELQSHVYNYAKDNNIKEDSFKEENLVGTGTSIYRDQLAHECVRQPPRSLSPIHCSEETPKFTEMSLAKNTAKESVFNPGQAQVLCKEYIQSDVEKPFCRDNSFNLLDMRADYETKEITVSSKGIQNSGEVPEMSVSHQKEVTVEGMESSGLLSTRSSEDISWSGGASGENCKIPDTKQSWEILQPLEEDKALNEVLKKLKHSNRKQQTLIQNLQCSNMHLEKKVEKLLQMKTTKQQVFMDIIKKVKANAEALIEDKYRVMLEKNDTDKTLQNLHDILTNTQKHLQESRNEKEILQVELKRIKDNYVSLRERYITEMQQKNKTVSQCVEMDKALSKKEEEVERLQQLKGDLEKASSSALDLLKREKEAQEQEFLSLQEEFQKRENENLEKRQKLKSRLEKLVAKVKNLQFVSESERAKNIKLQQQIDKVKNENALLQQQIARSEEQNYVPKFETAQLKEHLEEAMESDITKDAEMIHSNLFLHCSPCEEENVNPSDVKRTQLASKGSNLLAPMGIDIPNAEHIKENEKVSDPMIQKLKSFHLKKKNLDEEIAKLESLLESKEDHCNRLIEENDKYQKHLGNLIHKVRSYEEIIECADQRLKISHSQIAFLEERNKCLENLIKRPRERARKPKT
uniref:Cancer antigen 1 n=2 Tax=Rousettus aegyptiacus TaxID=9407 RepID=A0A7J8K5Q4_ROUAE|nr:cancer antigen 1 [Rousettus aegyptiacus]